MDPKDKKQILIAAKGPVTPEDLQAAFGMATNEAGMAGSVPGLTSDAQKAQMLQQLKLQALRNMQGGNQ